MFNLLELTQRTTKVCGLVSCCGLCCSVVHVELQYQVGPGHASFDNGISHSSLSWRLSLHTGEFVDFLRRIAVDGDTALQRCVQHRFIRLPPELGLCGYLLRGGSCPVKVRDHVAPMPKVNNNVKGWELHSVEFTIMPTLP